MGRPVSVVEITAAATVPAVALTSTNTRPVPLRQTPCVERAAPAAKVILSAKFAPNRAMLSVQRVQPAAMANLLLHPVVEPRTRYVKGVVHAQADISPPPPAHQEGPRT